MVKSTKTISMTLGHFFSILPRTSAWRAYTEVQTSRPPAGAATPTVPSPFPCIVVDKEVEAFRSIAP